MAQDLKSYINLIREKCPEKLLEIDRLIKPKFEVCALAQKFEARKEYPMLLFHNVENLRGEGNNKLIINLTFKEARPPIDQSEYDVIGGLLREPLKLVASETLGEDFLVPAEAEVILEGKIITNEQITEEPFGGWTGYIGGQCLGYKININCMYTREDPILVDHVHQV